MQIDWIKVYSFEEPEESNDPEEPNDTEDENTENQVYENIKFVSAENSEDEFGDFATLPINKLPGQINWLTDWTNDATTMNCAHTLSGGWWQTSFDKQYAVTTVKIVIRTNAVWGRDRATMTMTIEGDIQ